MNALAKGFYTVREAAELIEVGNSTRIKGWLDGYSSSHKEPLLRRDYKHQKPLSYHELSFYDLIEVRFVEHFRQHGVKPRTLRAALESAREIYKTDKPFATNKVRFCLSTDAKSIYVQESTIAIANKKEEPKLWNLLKQQYEIVEFIHKVIEDSIKFDASTNLAEIWQPRKKECPNIYINPKIAYGKPVVKSGIPTNVIYNMWNATNDLDVVRNWFEITHAQAREAIRFENEIRGNTTTVAA